MSETKIDNLRKLTHELDELDKEEASRKEREVYLLLNALTDMVIVSDNTNIIRYANPSSFRVLGYDPHELVGSDIDQILSVDIDEKNINSSFVSTARNKDGCIIPVHMYVGELKDGTIHLYISVIRKERANADTQESRESR